MALGVLMGFGCVRFLLGLRDGDGIYIYIYGVYFLKKEFAN